MPVTNKKIMQKIKVSPRFELGSSDSESEVLTITPRNLLAATERLNTVDEGKTKHN